MNKEKLIVLLKKVLPALKGIEEQNGKAYLVGGVVRDLVMNEPINDVDIEVHGLTPEQLEEILKKVGPLFYVGKQFGVYKIASVEIDWSLPRVDSFGRKPKVSIDPFLEIEQACRRRDITMNAMALLLNTSTTQEFGLLSMKIIDPFNGIEAINKKEISLIDPLLFIQDPLRFYRVMHFSSRFNFTPDATLTNVAKAISLKDPITHAPISKERIEAELKKMIIKGKVPSKGLTWVASLGRLLELFPEWNDLFDPSHENNPFFKAIKTLDVATCVLKKTSDDNLKLFMQKDPDLYYAFMLGLFAAHCIENELWNNKKEVRKKSTLLFQQFSSSSKIINALSLLLQGTALFNEMRKNDEKLKSYFLKKMAATISPTWTLHELLVFTQILFFSREPNNQNITLLMKTAEQLGILLQPEKPLLTGSDFLDEGLSGEQIGNALNLAYEIQIKASTCDPAFLKKEVLSLLFLQNKK